MLRFGFVLVSLSVVTLASAGSGKKSSVLTQCLTDLRIAGGESFAEEFIDAIRLWKTTLENEQAISFSPREWKPVKSSGSIHAIQATDGEIALLIQSNLSSRAMDSRVTSLTSVDFLEDHRELFIVGGMGRAVAGRPQTRLLSFFKPREEHPVTTLSGTSKELRQLTLPDNMGTVFYAANKTCNTAVFVSDGTAFDRYRGSRGTRAMVARPASGYFLQDVVFHPAPIPVVELKYRSLTGRSQISRVFDLRIGWDTTPSDDWYRYVELSAPFDPTKHLFALDKQFDSYLISGPVGKRYTTVHRLWTGQTFTQDVPILDSEKASRVARDPYWQIEAKGTFGSMLSAPGNQTRGEKEMLFVPTAKTVRRLKDSPRELEGSQASAPFSLSSLVYRLPRARPVGTYREGYFFENRESLDWVKPGNAEWSYFFFDPFGTKNSQGIILTGSRITQFSTKHPRLGTLPEGLLYGVVHPEKGRSPREVYWDLRTGEVVVTSPVERIEKLELNGPCLVFIAPGTTHAEGFKNIFTYSIKSRQFLLSSEQKRGDATPGKGFSRVYKPLEVPISGPIAKLTIEGLDKVYFLLKGSAPLNSVFESAAALLAETEESWQLVLDPKAVIRENDAARTGKILVSGAKVVQSPNYDEISDYRPSPVLTEGVWIQPLSKGESSARNFHFPGVVKEILPAARNRLLVRGTLDHVTTAYPTEVLVRSQGGGEVEYSAVGMNPEPMYKDTEYLVRSSQAVGEFPAKLIVTDLSSGSIFEAPLTEFASESDPEGVGEEQRKTLRFLEILSQIWGMDLTSYFKERVPLIDVTHVRRYRDLLLVTSKMVDLDVEITFFYSLRKKRTVFLLPNYAGMQVEKGRTFFLGQASGMNEAVIAVFSEADQRLSEYYRLGQLEVEIGADQKFLHISQQDAGILELKARGGHRRAFNERTRTFQGLLPSELAEVASKVASKLGGELNTSMFGSPRPPVFQRDELVLKLERALPLTRSAGKSRRVLLSGGPGTGTEDIARNYVTRYIEGDIRPVPDLKAVFIELNTTRTTGQTMYRGTASDKFLELEDLADAARKYGFRVVLIVPDIHEYLRDGHFHEDNEADVLKQLSGVLDRKPNIDLIATCDKGVLDRLSRVTGDFYKKMVSIPVAPLSVDETVKAVLAGIEYSNRTSAIPVQVDLSSLEWLVTRLASLSPNTALPGQATNLVEAMIGTLRANASPGTTSVRLERQPMVEALVQMTGVPKPVSDTSVPLDDLEEFLNKRVKFQANAIRRIVNALRAMRQGINRPDWPIGRFMLMGPTGVGKSEIVRALMEYFFGDSKDALLFISGDDWQTSRDTSELKNQIVKHLINHPFNLIQVDEWDKMHPDGQNVILTLADGMVANTRGVKAYSRLSLIIATSNTGSDQFAKRVRAKDLDIGEIHRRATNQEDGEDEYFGISATEIQSIYERAAQDEMTPAVRNRFDIVVMNPLRKAMILDLADSYLNAKNTAQDRSMRGRLLGRGIELTFDRKAVEAIVEGYSDITLGARGLDRHMERLLLNDLIAVKLDRGEMVANRKYRIVYLAETGEFEVKDAGKSSVAAVR